MITTLLSICLACAGAFLLGRGFGINAGYRERDLEAPAPDRKHPLNQNPEWDWIGASPFRPESQVADLFWGMGLLVLGLLLLALVFALG